MIVIKNMWRVMQRSFADSTVVLEEIRPQLDLMPQVSGSVHPQLLCILLIYPQS